MVLKFECFSIVFLFLASSLLLKTYRKRNRTLLETVEYLKAQEATRAANQMEIEDENIEVHRGTDIDLFSRTSNSLSRYITHQNNSLYIACKHIIISGFQKID